LSQIQGGTDSSPQSAPCGCSYLLKSSLSEDWHTFEKKSLAATGLRLEKVRQDEVLLARKAATANEMDWDTVDIGRWQPDFVLISRKRNAILELTRPSGVSPEQMKEAYREKIQKYAPIQLAFQHYIHTGWSIEIEILSALHPHRLEHRDPLMGVGIRGFADTKHLHSALE
jgi:hypothetical protein